MSELLLLDVNVLIALSRPLHEKHDQVIGRLHDRQRWATCSIVQLGFIRLCSTPGILPVVLTPAEAAKQLTRMLADPLHEYIGVAPAPAGLDWTGIPGHRQTTDLYLLAVAAAAGARFLTLDQRLGKSGVSPLVEVLQ